MQTSCAMDVAQEVQQQVEHLWKCVCMNAFQLMNETCCIKTFECSSTVKKKKASPVTISVGPLFLIKQQRNINVCLQCDILEYQQMPVK